MVSSVGTTYLGHRGDSSARHWCMMAWYFLFDLTVQTGFMRTNLTKTFYLWIGERLLGQLGREWSLEFSTSDDDHLRGGRMMGMWYLNFQGNILRPPLGISYFLPSSTELTSLSLTTTIATAFGSQFWRLDCLELLNHLLFLTHTPSASNLYIPLCQFLRSFNYEASISCTTRSSVTISSRSNCWTMAGSLHVSVNLCLSLISPSCQLIALLGSSQTVMLFPTGPTLLAILKQGLGVVVLGTRTLLFLPH